MKYRQVSKKPERKQKLLPPPKTRAANRTNENEALLKELSALTPLKVSELVRDRKAMILPASPSVRVWICRAAKKLGIKYTTTGLTGQVVLLKLA
jgi:hypothetical protein